MVYINTLVNLSRIKTKIAFNLTKHRLICFGIAAIICIPTCLLARRVKIQSAMDRVTPNNFIF